MNKTSNTNNSEKSNQIKTINEKLEPVTELELFAAWDEKAIDFSRYNDQDPKKLLINGYTVEMNNAFKFANQFGITTRNSINKANMEWGPNKNCNG